MLNNSSSNTDLNKLIHYKEENHSRDLKFDKI